MAKTQHGTIYVTLYEEEKDIAEKMPEIMKSQRLNKRELIIEALRYYIQAVEKGSVGFNPFIVNQPQIQSQSEVQETLPVQKNRVEREDPFLEESEEGLFGVRD